MKKFVGDSLLNILATLLITASMQLILLPIISNYTSEKEFGEIVIIIAILNSISALIGGSLNNLRLINDKFYDKFIGDFSLILILSLILGELIFLGLIYKVVDPVNLVILLMVLLLMTLRVYFLVYFRLTLSYKNILLHAFVLSIGYLIGAILFVILHSFSIAFLLGEIFSIIYLMLKVDKRELTFRRTTNLKKIISDYLNFAISNIANVLSLYLDRYIVLIILGSKYVSVYFIASLLGKLMSTISTPVASVILSYLNKKKVSNHLRLFNKMLVFSTLFGLLFYVVLWIISPLIIKVIYENSWENVKNYYNIANFSVILYLIGTFINTFCIKYLKMNRQLIIQYSYIVFFIVSTFFLANLYSLHGFIIGTILANTFRILLIQLICYLDLNIKNPKECINEK